jgi:hypothetical protein
MYDPVFPIALMTEITGNHTIELIMQGGVMVSERWWRVFLERF